MAGFEGIRRVRVDGSDVLVHAQPFAEARVTLTLGVVVSVKLIGPCREPLAGI